jgi:hypothetical protein
MIKVHYFEKFVQYYLLCGGKVVIPALDLCLVLWKSLLCSFHHCPQFDYEALDLPARAFEACHWLVTSESSQSRGGCRRWLSSQGVSKMFACVCG